MLRSGVACKAPLTACPRTLSRLDGQSGTSVAQPSSQTTGQKAERTPSCIHSRCHGSKLTRGLTAVPFTCPESWLGITTRDAKTRSNTSSRTSMRMRSNKQKTRVTPPQNGQSLSQVKVEFGSKKSGCRSLLSQILHALVSDHGVIYSEQGFGSKSWKHSMSPLEVQNPVPNIHSLGRIAVF